MKISDSEFTSQLSSSGEKKKLAVFLFVFFPGCSTLTSALYRVIDFTARRLSFPIVKTKILKQIQNVNSNKLNKQALLHIFKKPLADYNFVFCLFSFFYHQSTRRVSTRTPSLIFRQCNSCHTNSYIIVERGDS